MENNLKQQQHIKQERQSLDEYKSFLMGDELQVDSVAIQDIFEFPTSEKENDNSFVFECNQAD